MALDRVSDKKIISTNVAGFIQTQLTLLDRQRTARYLEDETRFQEAVLADNLTLKDQLDYRKEQLKRVKPDKEESSRVKTEIATLKDLIEADNFNTAYISQVNKFNQGKQSVDETIDWLTDRLKKTDDAKIKQTLQTNLSQLREQRFKLQQSTLEQQTNYAINDKSEGVLNTAIEKVSQMKKKALLGGNDNYAAVLDLQLQGLTKALTETQVNNELLSFSVKTITGQSAVAMLDEFNRKLKHADKNTPVTIGGVRYDNAESFWNIKRADFLNDSGESGFFTRYQNEILKQADTQISKGVFKTESLKQISDAFDGLRFRTELGDYSSKIDQEKQALMDKTANARAQQVLNKFDTDLDASYASRELSTIQEQYGVDMTINYQKLIQKAANEKQGQLQSLIQLTNQIASQNPGMSQADAFKKASESGGGVIYSPEQLATKPADQLFKDATESKGASNPAVTVNPATDAAPLQKPTFNEGGVYKTANNKTTYVYQNGQLRPLAGAFSNEEFKMATGKQFTDIQEIPSFGKTAVGANLTKQDLIKPPISPQGQTITQLVGRRPSAANPKVLEYYRTDNPSQGFQKGADLFAYLQGKGFQDIKDFKQVDPYFNK